MKSDGDRITIMLEMMRILENRLVYLHNFIVDATTDNRILAQLVTRFIDQLSSDGSTVLTSLEAIYYRSVAALYAGDAKTARNGFSAACASEESDEANDIKYKSYVMLGHLSHEDHDYAKAKELGKAREATIVKYGPPFSWSRVFRAFGSAGDSKIELTLPKQLVPQLETGRAYFLPSFYAP